MPLNSINIINYKLNSKLSNSKNSSVFGHLINRGEKERKNSREKEKLEEQDKRGNRELQRDEKAF